MNQAIAQSQQAKVLLIDNFDSFTYNLYQYLRELVAKVTVVRNNQVPFDAIRSGDFSHIVISPGPGDPTDPHYFGGASQVIKEFYKTIPILGICLGHQGIGAAMGGSVIKAPVPMHGKTSTFTHSATGLLAGLPPEITVMRYHSLIVEASSLSKDLIVDAVADDKSIMAMHHRTAPLYGIQFHPESFATSTGKHILHNFIRVGL